MYSHVLYISNLVHFGNWLAMISLCIIGVAVNETPMRHLEWKSYVICYVWVVTIIWLVLSWFFRICLTKHCPLGTELCHLWSPWGMRFGEWASWPCGATLPRVDRETPHQRLPPFGHMWHKIMVWQALPTMHRVPSYWLMAWDVFCIKWPSHLCLCNMGLMLLEWLYFDSGVWMLMAWWQTAPVHTLKSIVQL